MLTYTIQQEKKRRHISLITYKHVIIHTSAYNMHTICSIHITYTYTYTYHLYISLIHITFTYHIHITRTNMASSPPGCCLRPALPCGGVICARSSSRRVASPDVWLYVDMCILGDKYYIVIHIHSIIKNISINNR